MSVDNFLPFPHFSHSQARSSKSSIPSFSTPSATSQPQPITASPSTSISTTAGSPTKAPAVPTKGLLVPTDRDRDELEERWLSKLGRLKVEKEVVLTGYSLYSLRTWYLSRTHWSHTIVTQTGKPTEHITAYLLVPDPSLSVQEGKIELARAVQYLQSETRSHPRQTEYGTLLVNTPSSFGQDVSPVPSGDLRDARPYMIVNTGLRRLGCGGRAALGMESPTPALRRKFIELYRLPNPPTSASLTHTTSPTHSPANASGSQPTSATVSSPTSATLDPFTKMIIELVKLIQAALALWGMFGVDREDLEIDGLFCDETKAGIFQWRRVMGMENEESLRIEKETSGGCIDPKTLAALLSSVTSVHYELDVLGVDKIPKDPFTSVRRFLVAFWKAQEGVRERADRSRFLDVQSIRSLNKFYLNQRSRYPTDWLNVHRSLVSGVAHATSSLSANLKGGAAEDGPLRRREHRPEFRTDSGDSDTGMGMIIPHGDVGPVAPPDVITTDLEAYIKGILKSREKDWAIMGARRVAQLWNGHMFEQEGKRRHLGGILRRRTASRDVLDDDADDSAHARGRGLKGMTAKTGQAIKGGFGLRKGSNYETSDSDIGPTTKFVGRKQSTVPMVIEPDLEDARSISPSPLSHRHLEFSVPGSQSRRSLLTAAAPSIASKRPSLVTNGSSDHMEFLRSPQNPSERAVAWRDRGKATAMLRTASDGADVVVEEGGLEWEVVNPHGRGKREEHHLERRHSLQDRLAYQSTRVSPAEHLAVDVEMCSIVLELRLRERELARKAQDMKILEESIFAASATVIDALHARQAHLAQDLEPQLHAVEKQLQRTVEDLDEDTALQFASQKIQFYLSEDMQVNEVMWNIRELEKDWERVREKVEERRIEVERDERKSWWRLGW